MDIPTLLAVLRHRLESDKQRRFDEAAGYDKLRKQKE
jgi:hypothetical protein